MIDFIMIFGDNYVGKSFCLNKILQENHFVTSDEMFEDGTTEYVCNNVYRDNKTINFIDTPGLNSILQYQGFDSFRQIWSMIKNKVGVILLCVDCHNTRFSTMIRKFKQMIEFLDSKDRKKYEVNLLFNRYQNTLEVNNFIEIFQEKLPIKKSGFISYCYLDGGIIHNNGPIHKTTIIPGFKYMPNNSFKKDFRIPIGDVTIVKKSFDGKFSKGLLKLIWQIQSEIDIPIGSITQNMNLSKLIWDYNYGKDINEEIIREKIIKEIDQSLIFE